jgi:spoIIIJ-associated protein
MESFEISGKSVEEAVQKAAKKLGADRDQIQYTVLKEGKSGILGFGSEEARILVEPIEAPEPESQPEDDTAKLARDIINNLLKHMGFKAEASLTDPLVSEENGTTTTITFNIAGDDDIGILIGRHGQTISGMQYLVRVILAKKVANPPSVIVDVDGYKQRRYDALRATAKRLAEQVKMKKTPFTLEPMPAFERRIIHLTLANDPNVTTQSVGEGDARKVVIMPTNMRSTRIINNR